MRAKDTGTQYLSGGVVDVRLEVVDRSLVRGLACFDRMTRRAFRRYASDDKRLTEVFSIRFVGVCSWRSD